MFDAPESIYRVPYDGSFRVADSSTEPQTEARRHKGKYRRKSREQLDQLQRLLAAGDRHSVLLVFQAMDAAGKDSTIRAVMQGVDPAGCQVHTFKKPSSLELDHDFLWRSTCRLPERGRIGIFNRSQYEEVLIVRVNPKILGYQSLPGDIDLNTIWDDRLTSIRQQEEHLAKNGTVILKFFLNVSRDVQKERFLSRLDDPAKNWKFDAGDLDVRKDWDKYMTAYEAALNATSRPWAPWYAIPADNKSYMRARVSDIVIQTLQSMDMHYPEPSADDRAGYADARAELDADSQ